MTSATAIVLGGGTGTRFNAGSAPEPLPKQFQRVGGVPVFIQSVQSLLLIRGVQEVILTCPEAYIREMESLLEQTLQPDTPVRIIAGGARRQDSAFLALEAIRESPPERVLIHDACRPFLSDELLSRINNKLEDRSLPAWIPVVPVVETLKRCDGSRVEETVDRSRFFRAQTPQIFDFTLIHELATRAQGDASIVVTDDASLCERYGYPVGTFPGDERNIKLTYHFELDVLQDLREKDSCASESATTFTV